MKKIYIVDDEQRIRELIQMYLKKEGYDTKIFSNAKDALEEFKNQEPDLMILDIMMREMDGLELCREIRKTSDVPIIFVSARSEELDRILGLELGADDYLAKPFHLAELLARVKSIIRRKNQQGEEVITLKNVQLFPETRTVKVGDTTLTLNRKEYDLLYYFIIRPERLVEKTTLAEAVWGDYIDQVDSLDFIYSQIKNLRKKLKTAEAEIDLQAVYGIGYKLV